MTAVPHIASHAIAGWLRRREVRHLGKIERAAMMTFLVTLPVFLAVFLCLSLAQIRASGRSRCHCRTAAEVLESRRRQERGDAPDIRGGRLRLPIQQAAGHCGACGDKGLERT